jgi:hypothetical protein
MSERPRGGFRLSLKQWRPSQVPDAKPKGSLTRRLPRHPPASPIQPHEQTVSRRPHCMRYHVRPRIHVLIVDPPGLDSALVLKEKHGVEAQATRARLETPAMLTPSATNPREQPET